MKRLLSPPLLLLFLLFLCKAAMAQAQVHEQADEAFQLAQQGHKPVLLIFAGSDWCAPCIHFEKKILAEPLFLAFAGENLVLLKADFPQHTRQPEAIRLKNEALAEKYNPQGLFPHILLLRDNGDVISILPYSNQSPVQFIAEIKPLLLP